MSALKVGEIFKYIPTSTVGKVLDIREKDGKVWAQLDFTGLYYDVSFLTQADASEYKEVSFKEREHSQTDGLKAVFDSKAEAEEVDISEFTPSGGG